MSEDTRHVHSDSSPRTSTIEGWRGQVVTLTLAAEDLDLLDLVLCVAPELRIVTFLGKEARRRRLTYPVASARELGRCLGDDSYELGGHVINASTIAAAVPEQWFPISHEGELLSVVHLALKRCELEARRAFIEHALKTAAVVKPAGNHGRS